MAAIFELLILTTLWAGTTLSCGKEEGLGFLGPVIDLPLGTMKFEMPLTIECIIKPQTCHLSSSV